MDFTNNKASQDFYLFLSMVKLGYLCDNCGTFFNGGTGMNFRCFVKDTPAKTNALEQR